MVLEMKHPETGETIALEVGEMDVTRLQQLYAPASSESQLSQQIDNLSLPPEMKALLAKLKDFSIQVGSVALEIGKKILEVLIYFVKKFPNTSVGLVVGSVIGLMISNIPLIGWAISWLAMPLCAGLGLAFGFWKDMKNEDLKDMASQAISQIFDPLKTVSIPNV